MCGRSASAFRHCGKTIRGRLLNRLVRCSLMVEMPKKQPIFETFYEINRHEKVDSSDTPGKSVSDCRFRTVR